MKHSFGLGVDVFTAGLNRLLELYERGDRIIVAMSGGKDSTICAELAIMAATMAKRLPVEVIMRDEEIMFPGTFEYCERLAKRPEVDFHWVTAHQPVLNVFNRANPYVWVFDPLVAPEDWVRQPPSICHDIPDMNIEALITAKRYPPAEGKRLIRVLGLRVQESPNRKLGLISSGGYLTKPDRYGVISARPIYDWTDGHVWKAIQENAWDHNSAYGVMYRMGVSRRDLRIAPPLQTVAQVKTLEIAARAWPQWFDRVTDRCSGVRTAAQFGKRAVEPVRRTGETWEDCFWRECVNEAPAEWIAERSKIVAEKITAAHAKRSTEPFPEVTPARGGINGGCWKHLAKIMYNGDPFAMKMGGYLKPLEPEFFRHGGGSWGGTPGFS